MGFLNDAFRVGKIVKECSKLQNRVHAWTFDIFPHQTILGNAVIGRLTWDHGALMTQRPWQAWSTPVILNHGCFCLCPPPPSPEHLTVMMAIFGHHNCSGHRTTSSQHQGITCHKVSTVRNSWEILCYTNIVCPLLPTLHIIVFSSEADKALIGAWCHHFYLIVFI